MPVDSRITLDQIERLKELGQELRAERRRGTSNGRGRRRTWLDFERRLGVSLIDPNPNRLVLTPAGEAVLIWADEVLTGADDLVHELIGISAGSRGEVDLVATTVLASYVLPSVVAGFHAAHPDVRVRLRVADTDRALELVSAGHYDVALVSIEPSNVNRPLCATKLGQEQVLLVASPENDEPPAVITASEFEQLSFVEAEHGASRRDRELRRAGIGSRRIVARLGHPEAIKAAVRVGIGVAMLPASAVEADLASGDLRQVRVTGVQFGLPLCAVQREDVPPPTAAVKRLLDHLARELKCP